MILHYFIPSKFHGIFCSQYFEQFYNYVFHLFTVFTEILYWRRNKIVVANRGHVQQWKSACQHVLKVSGQEGRQAKESKTCQGKRCGLLRAPDPQSWDGFWSQALMPDPQRSPETMRPPGARRAMCCTSWMPSWTNLLIQILLANPNSNEKVKAVNSDILGR